MARQDHRLTRTSATELHFTGADIPVRVYASADVPIDRTAVDELLTLLGVQETLAVCAAQRPALWDSLPTLEAVSLSSDFHRGTGVPIGTTLRTQGCVLPAAMGSDINCGMQLIQVGIDPDTVQAHRSAIAHEARRLYFGGGRNIALTPDQRAEMLQYGLAASWIPESLRCHLTGLPTDLPGAVFDDYIMGSGPGATHDVHLGSLGGGNHFAEIQRVGTIAHGAIAYQYGIDPRATQIMVHTGSLGIGQRASDGMRALLTNLWGLRPRHGLLPLPLYGPAYAQYQRLMACAANFALVNRYLLARMLAQAITTVCGAADITHIYDAPHNLIWTDGNARIHRKGSTPASEGSALLPMFAGWGEPVIVPGSMGTSSWVLEGQGHTGAQQSACHGAGRVHSRGDAMRTTDAATLDAFLAQYTIVTPLDINRPDVRGRSDIVQAWREQLAQEAPWAYKPIDPIITTLADAGIARPVVQLKPLLTVKA